MFPATPDAQSAAAKRLTMFILKVIFSCIRWRIIKRKYRAVFVQVVLD